MMGNSIWSKTDKESSNNSKRGIYIVFLASRFDFGVDSLLLLLPLLLLPNNGTSKSLVMVKSLAYSMGCSCPD
jgi:hypothetical protein